MRCLLLLLLFVPLAVLAASRIDLEVVERADQDPVLFTQGFELYRDHFYVSSGLYGKSYLSRFAVNGTGKQQRLDVPPNVFAEGLTIFNGDLFLVSWKAQQAWRFDADTLQLEKSFHYGGEGWGLAHNDTQLILSDGSDTIKFIDPATFTVVRSIKVTENGLPVARLNELEFAKDLIWANQWKSNLVFAIDPDTGNVVFTVDVTTLQAESAVNQIDSVSNGIAYDAERDLFWLTGKYWQHRYLVRLLLPESDE